MTRDYSTSLPVLKLIRERYRKSIGDRPSLFGDEVKRAFVAEAVMDLMSTRFNSDVGGLRPMGDYVRMFRDSLHFLGLELDGDQG